MDGGQAADLSWIDAASERFQRAWKKRPRAVSRTSSPKWPNRNARSYSTSCCISNGTSAGAPATSRWLRNAVVPSSDRRKCRHHRFLLCGGPYRK